MIVHSVEFRWNESVTDQAITDLEDGLRAYALIAEGVRSYHFGRNLGLRPGTADFALIAHFESPEDVPRYLDHPEHIALVKRCVEPILRERTTVQFELGPDYALVG